MPYFNFDLVIDEEFNRQDNCLTGELSMARAELRSRMCCSRYR
jgi:hypothetical protein